MLEYLEASGRNPGFLSLCRRLEEAAHRAGLARLILESGEPLAAAMYLYRSIGFHVIPNYGHYIDMTASVCLEKAWDSGSSSALQMKKSRSGGFKECLQ